MAGIPADKIAEVRDRVDIERVVGRSVRLTRKGRRAWGLCPFHQEKTPSFSVDGQKRLYHCFGCQAGGDVFDFVMRIEGVDFREAVLLLAREIGVEIVERDEDPREREERARRLRMYEVNRIAAELYARTLAENTRAFEYLQEERGLSSETITRFNLGFAPADWSYLARHLDQRKLDVRLGTVLGLLGTRARDGSPYDRLRGRIIFPITLPAGDIAGFGARRADWVEGQADAPKYLNSPESPIYDKSSILFGLKEAKDEIRKGRTAVLVEGYVDVIGVHQAGLPIAVAACGTALSLRHASMLARLAEEVITLYDGDAAGQDAARKASEILLREGLRVRVARLPEGDDPDTFARRAGQDGLRALLDAAPSAIDFFVEQAKSAYKGGGIAGMAKAVDSVKPLLRAISDPLERDVCIDAAARQLGLGPAVLRRHLSGAGPSPGPSPGPGGPSMQAQATKIANHPERLGGRGPQPGERRAAAAPPPPVLEMALLRMFLETPKEVEAALAEKEALQAFTHPAVQAAIDAGVGALRTGQQFDAPRALEAAQASGTLDERATAILRKTLMEALPERDPLEVCVRRLLRNKNDITLRHLRRRLAEETDPETAAQLAKEADRINRIMASLT